MNRTVYLSVACDVDPDVNPHSSRTELTTDPNHIWQGVVTGIPAFRRLLSESRFISKNGQLPVTWLLRGDRQILELYADAGFCWKRFESIWESERKLGSEIGWHPHLYRWESCSGRWVPHLQQDDDVEMLSQCLASLRQHTDIASVRTGWDYHSNQLMQLLDDEGLRADASAIPGSLQTGESGHDWRGSPRFPFHPSEVDYRRPAQSNERALGILELPVLVRRLHLPLHLIRLGLRTLRTIHGAKFPDWESSRWQGRVITGRTRPFFQAAKQSLAYSGSPKGVFMVTYFHAGDLLWSNLLTNFIRNLENLASQAKLAGCRLECVTLRDAALIARDNTVHPPAQAGMSKILE